MEGREVEGREEGREEGRDVKGREEEGDEEQEVVLGR